MVRILLLWFGTASSIMKVIWKGLNKMISYIKGILTYTGENFIIVETGGIGYEIFVSPTLLSSLPTMENLVKIYTFMSVKDDGISLFGFSSREELDIFHKLITVSGVGPKGALGILSQLMPREIVMAILSEDVKTLSTAPGVGKKTAQRLILDLKDKFKTKDGIPGGFFEESGGTVLGGISNEPKFESIDALTALGYSRSEAAKAVGEIYEDDLTTEELLKRALKKIAKF